MTQTEKSKKEEFKVGAQATGAAEASTPPTAQDDDSNQSAWMSAASSVSSISCLIIILGTAVWFFYNQNKTCKAKLSGK